jgi:hypothetical protein
MSKRIAASLAALLVFGSVSQAFAWGGDGHRTVGTIATLRIKPHTARKIDQILKAGESLASVSTWADSVKERMGETDPDPDTHAFLQDLVHNEKNREWHYDDLPLNCTSYQTCRGFTLENDVVHLINASVRTLRGNPHPNYPLSRRNALRLLVHLVGDIHQPLHMGCGFIDERGPNGTILIVKDPNVIRRKNLHHDRGGNQLIINNDRRNLHSFWDFDLVKALMLTTNRQTPDELGTFLYQSVRPQLSWNTGGRLNTWAAQWATDSLRQSREHAYRSVSITRKRIVPVLRDGEPVIRDGRPETQVVYDIIRPANYDRANREIVRQQLAKAGFRLAKILDAIFANQR